MIPVLMLFLLPVGGGIPAGILLARSSGILWPVTAALYLVSDVIMALLCEPVLRLLIAVGRRIPYVAGAACAFREVINLTMAHYGGAGPVALVMIAFGVDPMTGRAAAAAAGHGFVKGWALAIAGDMLYFAVVMAATFRLNSVLGDPTRTMLAVLSVMIVLPVIVRRFKRAYFGEARRETSADGK